jgi:3-hydroxyisobutyrate dehydrogenase-like beta-hydroxyacid dehydrogenase
MGEAMVSRLLGAGHEIIVYNRTAAKASALIAQGAVLASTIADAASPGIVITMLADDSALRAVAQGAGGIIDSLPPGGVHLAMGTHDVKAIESLASEHVAAGKSMLCSPVLGRPDAVTAGRLGIIVAGESGAVNKCMPVLESLGRRVFLAGANPCSAAAMKLANNFLLACAIEALGEAFTLVEKTGVSATVFQDVITDGLFACPAYTTYAKIIAEKAWDHVGFTVALALKDVTLALAAGGIAGVPMPSANVCRDRLLGAIAHGDGQRDWAAMALEQARASGLS